jgi:putative ABC transport system permease protein
LTIPGTRAEPEHVVRVIGVAEDVRWESLAATPPPVVYRPMRFGSTISRTNNNRLLVRSLNPPKDVVASVREMIRRIDPALLIEPFLMEDVVSLSLVQQRTFAWVLGILAILGFLLAAIGIQGLIAQAVVERNREFGIRLAVGAERRQIIQLVLRSALVLIAVGTPLGIALAAVLARVLESRLFGVSPGDPRIYAAAIAALLAVVVGASLAPAIAASRANPADVLRS